MQHPNGPSAFPMPVRSTRERGGVMLAVVVILVPIVLILAAFTSSMTARTTRLQADVADERALLAAESGVDLAIFEARRGALFSGVPFTRTIGASSCTVTPTYLGSDGKDNDGDGFADLPLDKKEDVFELKSVGTYNRTTRRLAAYVGKTTFLPTINGAFTSTNTSTTITISGTGRLDGHNHRLDGTLVGSGDTYGIGAAPPVTPADVLAELSAGEAMNVHGLGGPPSVGAVPAVDLTAIVNAARNAATYSLSNSSYSSLPAGPAIYYREGELRLHGNVSASGLLVVTGRLRLVGTLDFKGVVIVLGEIDNSAGTVEILGGLLGGPSSGSFRIVGTADIRYSTEGIDLARNATGRYVAYNGWQELTRR